MEMLLVDVCVGTQHATCNETKQDCRNVADVVVEISGCSCLEGEHYDEHENLYHAVPSLMKKIGIEKGTDALRSLYRLCDTRNRHNRVAMVSSGTFNVIDCLVRRIQREDCDGLNLALLLINNLCIPYPNKILMILGESSGKLLDCLCRIMDKDIPERVLACICLVNLSMVQESVKPMLYHAPIQEWCPELSLMDNPESLIRILERFLVLKVDSTPIDLTVRKESLRWACSLAKNLCSCEENANLMSLSKIPVHVLTLLEKSALPPSSWTVESIEDQALRALCQFASWPILRIMLLEINAPDIIMGFTGGEDVYDYKSHEILSSLGGYDIEDTWEHKYEER